MSAYPAVSILLGRDASVPISTRTGDLSRQFRITLTMTTYQQVIRAIFEHVDYSRTRQVPYNASTYNLDRMRALNARLGFPHRAYPSLHIAGSKGKGSTAAMTTAILQAAGYRTGLYTSPHLHSFRERIRIDGRLIPHERLVELWEILRPHVDAFDHTTTFEIITTLAFMHFADPPVDWAVLEVGLGGRLDATNIIEPRACAITTLTHEHTDLLGHTLSLIAFEKAGIIKPGVPVVVGPQVQEAMQVIEDVAEETGARLWRVGNPEEETDIPHPRYDWTWRIREATMSGSRIDIVGPDWSLSDLYIPLAGYHQAANATVAVALLASLQPDEIHISPDAIREGMANTYWPGRLEILSRLPFIVADSAHTRQSAERIRQSLALYPHRRLILLFGASADKDIRGMLEVLGVEAHEIIVTRSFHPRAADPHTLADLARDVVPGVPVHITEDALPALELAETLTRAGDMVLVTGSIFVVAAVRESLCRLQPDAFPAEDWVHHAEPIDGVFTPMLATPTHTGTR